LRQIETWFITPKQTLLHSLQTAATLWPNSATRVLSSPVESKRGGYIDKHILDTIRMSYLINTPHSALHLSVIINAVMNNVDVSVHFKPWQHFH